MFNLPVNEKIVEIRYMSYYYLGKLVDDIIIVFLKFSNGFWYKIDVSDGISTIEQQTTIDMLESGSLNDDFYYPINVFNRFAIDSFSELIEVEEYLWKGIRDESCGLVFKFNNGTFLNIIEKNETIIISNDNDDIKKEWTLHKYTGDTTN